MIPNMRTEPARLLLWFMLMGTALKLVAVHIYTTSGETLLDVGFGFAHYVDALIRSGEFASCGGGVCRYAERMPGLPLFMWASSEFTDGLRVAAVVKCALLSGLLCGVCRHAIAVSAPASYRFRFVILLFATFLVFSPNLIKHAASLHYEEGFLVEILAILAVSLMSLAALREQSVSVWQCTIPVIAAASAYLLKSSMISIAVMATCATVVVALSKGRRVLAFGLLTLALCAPAGWGLHSWVHTSRVSAMSSYDGENLFRGWNANTLDLYPHCTLDLLFTPEVVCGERSLSFPAQPDRASFKDEWAWHDYYSDKALRWVRDQPMDALKLLAVKSWVMFVTIDAVPHFRVTGSSRNDMERTQVERWLSRAWLLGGRLVQIVWVVCAILAFRHGDGQSRNLALIGLGLPLSYALPYVLGFAYERHYSLFILLVSICTLFLLRDFCFENFSEVKRRNPA
jgi:hypothetical protein